MAKQRKPKLEATLATPHELIMDLVRHVMAEMGISIEDGKRQRPKGQKES